MVALGITWILDGVEASLVANLGPTLMSPHTLGLTAAAVGLANSAYLLGQVIGALVFGFLTDRWGRKRLFLITLGIYLGATALSGAAPNFAVFFESYGSSRGPELVASCWAINTAIDELVPARLRRQMISALTAVIGWG